MSFSGNTHFSGNERNMEMMKLGMHVDNWRHFDMPYDVPCQFAKDHGMKYVEFGTIDGDYFIEALGYSPHIPLHSDPMKLKGYLDSLGLKTSQLYSFRRKTGHKLI